MKAKIAIVGSGNIGWALKQLLMEDYEIKQGDITEGLDATDISQVKEFLPNVIYIKNPQTVCNWRINFQGLLGYFNLFGLI